MAVQTSYQQYIPVGVAGAIVDMIPKTLISRTVEVPAGIAFGVPVYRGTGDKGVVSTGTAANYIGFTVLDRSVRIGDVFSQYESARIMTDGQIWVVAPTAVADGAAVVLGGVTIPGAFWQTTTTTTNQLAQVRLNRVSPPAA